MSTSSIQFDLLPNDPLKPLGVEVWFDQQLVVDIDRVVDAQFVSCEFDEDVDQNHQLKIIIKNKTPGHTVINSAGEIVADSIVEIQNFKIDQVDIEQLVQQKSVYTHDFNGSQPEINDHFYGVAGCNGIITLDFFSPSYIWLLENM